MLSNKKKWGSLIIITTGILVITGVLIWCYSGDSDACQLIANKHFVDYVEVIACYRSFEFDSKEASKIIENIREHMQVSYITNIYKDHPGIQLKDRIDIGSDLKNLGKQEYSTDFDFHYVLSKYFDKLQLGNTEYRPMSYDVFKFRLPISLKAIHEDNEVKLKASVGIVFMEFDKEWTRRKTDYKKYDNDIVLEIEGKPALQYIKEFADDFVGASRDPNYRIKHALYQPAPLPSISKNSLGLFTSSPRIPNQQNITIIFKNNGKVTIPYVAINSRGFKNKKSFYKTYFETNSLERRDLIKISEKVTIKISNYKLSGNFIKIYYIKDVAIMFIHNFPSNDELISSWKEELHEAINLLKKDNKYKIIFELSNNKGGLVGPVFELLQFFFPQHKDKLYQSYLINNPFIKVLAIKFKKTQGTILNEKEKKNINNFIQTVNNHANSKQARIPFEIDWSSERVLTDLINDKTSIPFQPIALITNGLCISSCGLFTNWIQEVTDIPTYYLDNLLNQPSPLGTNIGYGPFQFYNGYINMSILDHPKFKTKTKFNFPFIGFYSHKYPQQPLELNLVPAKENINITGEYYRNPDIIHSKIIDKLL